MTSLFIPAMDELSSFETLQNIIAHLRSAAGCPWDREQTHKSLRPFLIEEAYETLEALDADDPTALYEEMGDLLLQILLHTQIAIDEGEFKMSDLLQHLNEKMIRRHPHVFGDIEATDDLGQLSRIWHEVKQAEKASRSEPIDRSWMGFPRARPLCSWRSDTRSERPRSALIGLTPAASKPSFGKNWLRYLRRARLRSAPKKSAI